MKRETLQTVRQIAIFLLTTTILLTIVVLILLNKLHQLNNQIPQFTDQQVQQICIEEELY